MYTLLVLFFFSRWREQSLCVLLRCLGGVVALEQLEALMEELEEMVRVVVNVCVCMYMKEQQKERAQWESMPL